MEGSEGIGVEKGEWRDSVRRGCEGRARETTRDVSSMCVHMHTHTHTLAHTHARAHTHAHAHTHSHTHTHTHRLKD